MSKPVFDISLEDQSSIEWLQCRLVIEMNQQYFYYVVLQGEHLVVSLKYYQFTSRNIIEMILSVEEIMKEDGVLREKMKECIIIYNWPENCLVPANHFDIDVNKDLLELLHGDVNKGIIHSEKIHAWDTYNVYRIPFELHDFFQRHFSFGKYWHYYTVWLKCLKKDGERAEDQANVLFYPNKMIVAVVTGGLLQVVQSLEYQTADDVIFHMLNIFQRFQLTQGETMLQISGMIDQKSGLYEELVKYFSLVKTDPSLAELEVSEGFKSFPEHFFSPLLKLALCV